MTTKPKFFVGQIVHHNRFNYRGVVVDVDAAYYAVVGENLMKFARQNNYAGIVVNGYIRDTFQIRDIPVALYALGSLALGLAAVAGGVVLARQLS